MSESTPAPTPVPPIPGNYIKDDERSFTFQVRKHKRHHHKHGHRHSQDDPACAICGHTPNDAESLLEKIEGFFELKSEPKTED